MTKLKLKEVGNMFGYVNENWVIKPRFLKAREFSEGYACVNLGEKSKWLWGFIGTNGQWAVEPEFRSAWDFVDGVARVQKPDGNWYLLDKEKNLKLLPSADSLDRIHELESASRDGRFSEYMRLKSFYDRMVQHAPILVVDPFAILSLEGDIISGADESIEIKSFDLAVASDGDYDKIVKGIKETADSSEGQVTILLDNADCIPDSSDREKLEELVFFALKPEDEFTAENGVQLNPTKLNIVVRAKKYPRYLSHRGLDRGYGCVVLDFSHILL